MSRKNSSRYKMSPEASPGTLHPRTGVRRVNNVPLFIVGGAVATFVVVIALVAAGRAEQQRRQPEEQMAATGNTMMFAEAITSEYADESSAGMIAAERPPMPVMELESASENSIVPETIDASLQPEVPALQKAEPENTYDEEAERIRMMKFELFQQAVRARTTVSTEGRMSSPTLASSSPNNRSAMLAQLQQARQRLDAITQENPTAAYQAKLAQLQSMGGVVLPSVEASASSGGGYNEDYEEFNSQEMDRWRLDSKPEKPRSPFELRAGFVIPAIMLSGINSDLPGQITAQVSQNVYDTPTGRHLLIPQGARLVGRYSNDVVYGQSRVLVAWQRIIFPDGKSMDIGAMPGTDGAGYSGFNDKVNNHYMRVFGSAILMSGIVAGVNITQDEQDLTGNSQRSSDALSEALGQQLGQVTAQIISKNLNIAPTLEIRPGYRFNVIATKDLTFKKPYQSFDYD